jgi:dTDP-L-rhamnose 4-epimerase
MKKKVLITGGAGFLGTHLTRELLRRNCEVTILDDFSPQVHGTRQTLADDLRNTVPLIQGDVRERDVWEEALDGQSCVVHLAAETGTGRSMYDVAHYEQVNIGGTAQLYDLLAQGESTVERIVLASSRAVYGEGAYRCAAHGLVYPASQPADAMLAGRFDPVCPVCNAACTPAATPESAPMRPASFYGLTKQMQEQTALLFGGVLNIPTVALRYQNIYGPGQSLENPYTGILAIFSNLARAGACIEVFEDGHESRDFVFIDDAVRATADSVTNDLQGQHAVNIGSGTRTSLLEIATAINAFHGGKSELRITGAFRKGDIRHALADLTLARDLLSYEPRISLSDGLDSFLAWAAAHASGHDADTHARSLAEMRERGLLHG